MHWFAFLCWSVSSHHHLERGSDRLIGNVEIECHDPTIVLIENNIHNLRHIPVSGKHLARRKLHSVASRFGCKVYYDVMIKEIPNHYHHAILSS